MEGAYYNGQYLNRLERLGYSQAEIDNKLESTFEEMFYGPEGVRLCHCAGPDMMYIEDTGNHVWKPFEDGKGWSDSFYPGGRQEENL